MTPHPQVAAGLAPGGHYVMSLALVVWVLLKASRAFVGWFDRHDGTHTPITLTEEPTLLDPRPRPLRTIASWIGGLSALIAGLVGSGLLTTGQGNALTGVITAVVALLAAFGLAAAGEKRVTPLTDPRDDAGHPLVPAQHDHR